MVRQVGAAVAVGAMLSLIIVASSQAAHTPGAGERAAIARAAVPPKGTFPAPGKLAWAEVSSKGPFALAWVTGKTPRANFQDALLVLKRIGRRWQVVADAIHTRCRGVPRLVVKEFDAYLHRDRRRMFNFSICHR